MDDESGDEEMSLPWWEEKGVKERERNQMSKYTLTKQVNARYDVTECVSMVAQHSPNRFSCFLDLEERPDFVLNSERKFQY